MTVSGEGIEGLVEGESVDCVHLGARRVIVSVTFEAEIISKVNLVLIEIDVFDATSSLNRADSVSLSVGKALDARRGTPQRGDRDSKWIEIVIENILQVPVVHDKLRMGCHQQRELATHVVDWHAQVRFSDLVELSATSPGPDLDS